MIHGKNDPGRAQTVKYFPKLMRGVASGAIVMMLSPPHTGFRAVCIWKPADCTAYTVGETAAVKDIHLFDDYEGVLHLSNYPID